MSVPLKARDYSETSSSKPSIPHVTRPGLALSSCQTVKWPMICEGKSTDWHGLSEKLVRAWVRRTGLFEQSAQHNEATSGVRGQTHAEHLFRTLQQQIMRSITSLTSASQTFFPLSPQPATNSTTDVTEANDARIPLAISTWSRSDYTSDLLFR